MISEYHHDYIELLIGFVGLIIGIILIIRNRKEFNSYKAPFFLIFCGISLLIFGIVCNSSTVGRWDKNFIIAFLSLRVIDGGGWLCRGPAFFGYTFFVFGITILLVVISKRDKGPKI
jgi:Ca2+/Na+ antiporter